MWIIKPEFAATSTSACSCGLGMFAYVKRYVPEAIIVLQTATFCNRIRGYIRCPQFSLQRSPFSLCCTSVLQFSLFPRTFSVLIIILVPVRIQSVILFLQCLIFLCSCLCLKCLIVSPSSLILVSTPVCHYYVIILLVISISQIHRLVGKTPLVIFIYYF